jgi:hypothetical protein
MQVQQLVGMFTGWVSSALNGNPLIAGAATASIFASIAYFARGLPKKFWFAARRFVVFTYYIEYDYDDGRTMIQMVAEKFEHALQKRISGQRSTARLTTRKKRLAETLADGGFFFYYAGAWIWVSRRQEQQQKGEKQRRIITLSLTSLRMHRKRILEVLGESAREYTVPGIYQLITPPWSSAEPKAMRQRNFTGLPILALDHKVKQQIDEAIDTFLRHREKKNRMDFPHKLVIMLYGEPGTGKSALAEYIAWRLRTSLFVVNAISSSGHNPVLLSEMVYAARENITEGEVPVLLMDDFDTYMQGLRKRQKTEPKPGEFIMDDDPVLGRMLASLQSPTEVTDCVVIFTTNHLEQIDPALYRPGRVTCLIEVGRMEPRSIMEYYEKSYGRSWPAYTPIERSLRACDISAFFSEHEDDPEGFVQAVTSSTPAADEVFRSKADTLSV